MESVPVTVEITQQFAATMTIEEVGKLKATDSAALTFSAGEKLKSLQFKDGDTVKKGDLIAQLDDSKAKAELEKSSSSLALAKSKLSRVLALLKKQPDSMSAQDVEELKQQVALAEADYSQRKTDLQSYQLIAPFDGQLTSFSHSVGSRVEAAVVLVHLIKLDPVEVHYSISQSEVGKAELGQSVTLKVDAYSDSTFSGRVDYIAPLVDESSGRVEVHAKLDNADNRLVPGMFAKVSQDIGESINHVVVSQTAVGADGKQRFVWLIRGDKAVKQPIELGENINNGYVAVKSGLSVGERVVITGQQNLDIGVPVIVQGSKPSITLPALRDENKTAEEKRVEESRKSENQSVEVDNEAT
ncbi:probable Co/Zn/Cd efflux system membrane fusion protein [Vibrio orientalis CIP 102891 = ATCC 33934]|uniref:Probable Co/Zn/Cd efflux system membrane fusion protein n=1 Tax=Vibrio orientalis CIP 102891 = ATCC 33934 TaxID=675816 RepID=A0ABP2GWW1_VIBOR|nr:probable Co/Zn/Cd efflux system membrane fusion protein [Vibrio orientalis CIP 102891 = ATCC 33934]